MSTVVNESYWRLVDRTSFMAPFPPASTLVLLQKPRGGLARYRQNQEEADLIFVGAILALFVSMGISNIVYYIYGQFSHPQKFEARQGGLLFLFTIRVWFEFALLGKKFSQSRSIAFFVSSQTRTGWSKKLYYFFAQDLKWQRRKKKEARLNLIPNPCASFFSVPLWINVRVSNVTGEHFSRLLPLRLKPSLISF